MEKFDPRRAPRPLDDVPALVADGAARWNAGEHWEAHETWEEAWHALRGAGRADDAAWLQGLILATAAWENLRRGKPTGFRRQGAHALHRLRARPQAGAALGLADSAAFVEALTAAYLDLARRTDLAEPAARGAKAPALELSPPSKR